jgi:hypothetical protein
MMLSLELHSSHNQQPKNILLPIVAATDNLMMDKRHVRVGLEPLLSLVVTDQQVGRIQPPNQLTDKPIHQIGTVNVKTDVVASNQDDIQLNRITST